MSIFQQEFTDPSQMQRVDFEGRDWSANLAKKMMADKASPQVAEAFSKAVNELNAGRVGSDASARQTNQFADPPLAAPGPGQGSASPAPSAGGSNPAADIAAQMGNLMKSAQPGGAVGAAADALPGGGGGNAGAPNGEALRELLKGNASPAPAAPVASATPQSIFVGIPPADPAPDLVKSHIGSAPSDWYSVYAGTPFWDEACGAQETYLKACKKAGDSYNMDASNVLSKAKTDLELKRLKWMRSRAHHARKSFSNWAEGRPSIDAGEPTMTDTTPKPEGGRMSAVDLRKAFSSLGKSGTGFPSSPGHPENSGQPGAPFANPPGHSTNPGSTVGANVAASAKAPSTPEKALSADDKKAEQQMNAGDPRSSRPLAQSSKQAGGDMGGIGSHGMNATKDSKSRKGNGVWPADAALAGPSSLSAPTIENGFTLDDLGGGRGAAYAKSTADAEIVKGLGDGTLMGDPQSYSQPRFAPMRQGHTCSNQSCQKSFSRVLTNCPACGEGRFGGGVATPGVHVAKSITDRFDNPSQQDIIEGYES